MFKIPYSFSFKYLCVCGRFKQCLLFILPVGNCLPKLKTGAGRKSEVQSNRNTFQKTLGGGRALAGEQLL